jgi:hypothetical protein
VRKDLLHTQAEVGLSQFESTLYFQILYTLYYFVYLCKEGFIIFCNNIYCIHCIILFVFAKQALLPYYTICIVHIALFGLSLQSKLH